VFALVPIRLATIYFACPPPERKPCGRVGAAV
jgi:hypothetical protein